MAIDKKYFEKLLITMGYKLENGAKKVYKKTYIVQDSYNIFVDFESENIDYETRDTNAIMVSNKTTSNFSKPENMVVLECVDRLLTLGYSPSSIELEHAWPSGHNTSGRLDIMLKKDGKSYIMIECKTYGKEFDKEKQNTLQLKKVGKEEQPKGQLFSYCWEEKSTEYLCLYASEIKNNKIYYQNAIIQVEKEWKNLSNKKELYDYWNKIFKKNGIFENDIKPYNIECKALLRKDLEKITNEDSSRIFNQFLEILRHNSVSDKPNAFNKILNLFICKIIDEEKADNEELKFQWKDDSDYISLQSNLEELYKQGMDRFLNIEVTDYSDNDIDNTLIAIDNNSKTIIKKMFQELRLQKNPEFAFKEVYNQESFEENAKVLKEVVELLQTYQFRYGHKQQFLGNFFEQLLNTSIKQESGQFFTPVPIARFMISSLPLYKRFNYNIENNSKNILPIAIDYACGAGHFLTEYMDVLQEIINKYDTSNLGQNLKNKIEKWKQNDNQDEKQGEFEWAKDCVYGIEKDYRLAKTTKISTFLNGDGEANIIHADGLDKFDSEKYKGLLISKNKENANFDFVIANPPYSVSAFKQTLNVTDSDFDLYSLITENSSEIECLFLERTKQLLKDSGCAAIILPSSIFSNSGLTYEKTREIMFENFYIRAIAKMGTNTFMATGTNTVILFIEKRPSNVVYQVKNLIDSFFETNIDFNYDGYENVVGLYINENYENITFNDYLSYINNIPTKEMRESDIYKKTLEIFEKTAELKNLKSLKTYKMVSTFEKERMENNLLQQYILNNEKKKIFYYILTFSYDTLLIDAGEKQEEKDFLGYEFSNRRGYEGIHYYKKENGSINSSLYDDCDLFNNVQKVNYYILNSFDNNVLTISKELENNLNYIKTNDLLTFDNVIFDNTISLKKKNKVIYNCDSMPISKCCNIKIGGTPARNNHAYFKGNNLWVSIAEMNGQKITNTKEKITDEAVNSSNVKLIKQGTTLLSFKLTLGKVAIAGKDLYTNEAIAGLEIKEEYKDKLLDSYLFYLFKSKIIDIEGDIKAFGNSLNSTTLGDIIIPIPSLEEQNQFIIECKKGEKDIENIQLSIDNLNMEKEKFINNSFAKENIEIILGDERYLTMKRGPFGGDLKKEIFVSSGYKVYEQKNAINNDFSIGKYYITQEKYDLMEAFQLLPGDIIMSCSGTLGLFAVFNKNSEKGIINQNLMRFRPNIKKIIPEFLKLCLENIVDNIKKEKTGLGCGALSSVDALKKLKIIIPENIEEQIRILDDTKKFNLKINSLIEKKNKIYDKQKELIKKYI